MRRIPEWLRFGVPPAKWACSQAERHGRRRETLPDGHEARLWEGLTWLPVLPQGVTFTLIDDGSRMRLLELAEFYQVVQVDGKRRFESGSVATALEDRRRVPCDFDRVACWRVAATV